MKEKMQNRQSRWFQSQAKEWFSLIRIILGKEVKQSLVSIFYFCISLQSIITLKQNVYVVYPKMVRNIIIYPRIFLRFTDPILKLDNNRSESFLCNMYLSSTTMIRFFKSDYEIWLPYKCWESNQVSDIGWQTNDQKW